MDKTNILLFSGYARLPSGTVSSEVYTVMALVVLVDIETDTIVEVDSTLSTRLAERFVSRLIVGQKLEPDIGKLVGKINHAYQGSANKAIITALRIIADKYQSYKLKR
ncbi:DUF3870 domain-containing protein [Acetonema longum]|uniref:DUF3870 domain-containing protein n=1 Tax=Acetonema longum DSM 6540 TaxID=1009370 RepID=F7NEZ4_9FIRM|nr:DUF3870 domain-containing protein [Acetonema longum]EGO65555.1 hypothetical protein ALO_03056 [Acetonema longum DSM 6540]